MFTSALLNTILRYAFIAGSIGSILYYVKYTVVTLNEAENTIDRLHTKLMLKDKAILDYKERLNEYTKNYNIKIKRDTKIKKDLEVGEYTYSNVFNKISIMEATNEK